MDPKDREEIAARVAQAATAALEARGFVSAIDVLMGMGWLAQARVDAWRDRKLPFLEAGISTNPVRVAEAMKVLGAWVVAASLKPSETGYVGRTGGKAPLRFTREGGPEVEKAYRTHWLSPRLLEKKA